MEHATTVFIADGAEDFCANLTAALQRTDGFRVVGTASDGEQAIALIQEPLARSLRSLGKLSQRAQTMSEPNRNTSLLAFLWD